MKQVLFTCSRCRKQAVESEPSAIPLEWAVTQYTRVYIVASKVDDKPCFETVTSTAHACGDCAQGVLDYIEPVTAPRHG